VEAAFAKYEQTGGDLWLLLTPYPQDRTIYSHAAALANAVNQAEEAVVIDLVGALFGREQEQDG
jgi:hypothetical protein